MSRKTSDRAEVVIVGAGIAGATAALCFAKQGVHTKVIDHVRSPQAYKALCTHFIQPAALPVLRRLNLDTLLEAHGAVRTKAAFWTPSGWIDPEGDYGTDIAGSFAYCIERRVLDPLLRQQLHEHPSIDLRLNQRIQEIERTESGWRLTLHDDEGERTLHARLLVAADGRASRLARLLGNPESRAQNDRAACFCYFADIGPIPAARSLFMLEDAEMAFAYPLSGGRMLLAAYVTKQRAQRWSEQGWPADRLVEFLQQFPVPCDMSRARPISRVYRYHDYPNIMRSPVWQDVAFIGDAALSLDPMSGVGCCFAMLSAEMLSTATRGVLSDECKLHESLGAYRKSFESYFPSHVRGITADSLLSNQQLALRVYELIAADERLQKTFIALTGRLISPDHMQRAVWEFFSGRAASAATAGRSTAAAGAPAGKRH